MALSVCHRLDVGDRTNLYLTASCPVCLFNPPCAENLGPGGKIRAFDDFYNLFNISLSVLFYLIVDDLYHSGYHLTQIVRRNIGSHANCNSRTAVD